MLRFTILTILCCSLITSNIFTRTTYPNLLNYQVSLTSATTIHSPIVINHNDNFTTMGLPGIGSQNDPFRIEGFSISDTDACINITGTSAFVSIQDCILTDISDSFAFGVSLWNVSNCYVIRCDIDVEYWGVWMYDCQNCGVFNSDIKGNDACIIIEESINCTVSSNALHEHRGAGLYFDECNYSIANDNSVDGQGIGQTGIGAFGAAWYCIIANNTINGHYGSAVTLEGIECLVINNTIIQNGIGIYVHELSENNTITLNRLEESTFDNARDLGSDNIWISNWFSDYMGVGPYTIPGSAQSIDQSPRPQNVALLVSIVSIPTIAALLIIVGLWKRYRKH